MCSNIWWVNAVLFVVGLVVLMKGSDWFIDGAAYIAHHYRVPDTIIGLTLVSMGTSLPELATNVYAAVTDQAGVALGNVTGSNVTNVLLILGVCATVMPNIPTDRTLFRRDTVLMGIVSIIFALFCYYGGRNVITRWEAAALLLGFVLYTAYLVANRGQVKEEAEEEVAQAEQRLRSVGMAFGALVGGGVMVALGANLMVDNVVWMASRMGVSNAILSATLVALGTSLPELAVTVAGLIKKKNDIAMGNIVGSNIFNILLVMGATCAIRPQPVNQEILMFVLPFMLGAGALLLLFMRTGWRLARWEGVCFLLGYGGFIGISVFQVIQGSRAGA